MDIGPNTLRYPDIVVDPAGEASRDLVATAPQLIAEVLSPSTERIDLGDKAAEYLGLSSFSAYLVFAQDELKAWAWARGPNGFPSGPQVHSALDAVIRIVAPAVNFPLADVYARVKVA